MSGNSENGSLESRVEALAQEVQALGQRVQGLERQLEAGSAVLPERPQPTRDGSAAAAGDPWTWGSASTVLSRAATVCFVLVVALILRTVTDADLLSLRAGAILGTVYASALLAASWFLYARSNRGAPTFSVCGALLLCTVIWETHTQYKVFSSLTAHALLIFAGGAATAVGRRFRTAAPVCAGTSGMVVAGLLLDLSDPVFNHLGMLLLAASVFAYLAADLPRCWWLRVVVLIVSVSFWLIWSLNLNGLLGHGATVAPNLAFAWFLPLLCAFVFLYLASGWLRAARKDLQKLSFLDSILPSFTVGWAFSAAAGVLMPLHRSGTRLGLASVAVSVVLLVLASQLARSKRVGAPGTNAFAFAGCLLLALAVTAALDSAHVAFPLLSVAACGLCVLSASWHSGGTRLTSYLLQFYACAFAFLVEVFVSAEVPALGRAASVGVLACVALFHYRWSRSHPPSETSAYFSRFDKTDDTAIGLLLVSLAGAFLLLRVGAYELIKGFPDPANAFQCAQTVVVNLGALALVLGAFFKRNRELRGVAIFVIILGALKVLLFDLWGAHGVPLVLSVFSFGLAAALGALVLGRWHRLEKA